ncbi:bifunctional adenosylcobinamide kinase/adenosylcobinamide-phosphate guanylyltransferase [Phenylobacterium sp.]|uniref:bifunctional adenosylcobinamide kinase/adenosylcobinamide-phosphate guanylyltransferase n=1 Tax=Phenylobacterium sp. TaxID=1871053 RepID=UPI0027345BCA|nr:bifunctional adenosylcobinamide kinase/adenosylcobinamide-phosphate guanylyltransferase [Phenylobacterium sp.]MDP3660368.1 bifunctional adenosylcobinamide kinase/adenosylcobinamide-phosphate guanylyltransferase [Phenylobacterium sp.]
MAFTLVIGGARSGKSAYASRIAEAHARETGVRPIMMVTAEALDAEMAERIAVHRADRGEAWLTVETPRALTQAVTALEGGDVAVLDCVTLWLSNHLLDDADLALEVSGLVLALSLTPAQVVVVTNEVGQGVVPDNALARHFRDEAGRANQALAAAAERVVLITAGLPLTLKP